VIISVLNPLAFRPEELAAALRRLKLEKSPGLDSILPEFILHAGSALKSWFPTSSLLACANSKFQRFPKKELIVAVPKPEKPLGDTKSYSLISLLCDSFEIYALESIIDLLLPQEQAGFRHGSSTVDQVTLLTYDIDDSSSVKKKAGAVFVDLTAAHDIVWHRGLT